MNDTNDSSINEKYNISVDTLPKSRKEITGEIPWDEIEQHREAVISSLAENIEVDGFRKGNVPEDMIVEKVGEDRILHQMAERALQAVYPKIIAENAPQAVGQPDISITKLAEGNPLGFKAEVPILPEIKLADYTSIAKELTTDEVEVEAGEEDVREAINKIRKQWVQSERMEKIQKLSEQEDEEMLEQAQNMDPRQMKVEDEDLPELTDEFVQKLGEFEDVDDFKSKLRQNILQEEERKQHEKRRLAIIEEIVEKSDMDVPEVIVESELQRMMNQFKADVQHAGAEFDDYLERIEKTEEDLRDEWRSDAEKQAKIQLVLNAIAREEEIEPDEDEIDAEVERITEQYESADTQRARTYVATMLRNEKVFNFLEGKE